MINFFLYMQLLSLVLLTFFLSLPAVIFMIYIIRYLLTTPFNFSFNPPKAHAFVEIPLKSAFAETVIAIGALSPFISNLVLKSAYLFSVAMYLIVFTHHIGFILVPTLMDLMEQIIRNTLELRTQALAFLNNQSNSLAMLREAHAYLTPYIRSYDSLFHFIQRIVSYLDRRDSEYMDGMEDLEAQYRGAGNSLLAVYRSIEREISISIDESPISLQD